MHYKRNYLTQVLLRLDFPTLSKLQGDRKTPFSAEIEEKYPVVSSNQTTQVSLTFSPSGPGMEQQQKGLIWVHRNEENGKKAVRLSSDYLAMEYGKEVYKHMPTFKEDFEYVYSKFQKLYEVQEFTRMGLRYINEVTFNEGNPLNWDNLINDSLVNAVKAGLNEKKKLVRSMHQLYAQQDDVSILFQYGIFNIDFPTPVARRQFILDFDCFIGGIVTKDEVLTRLNDLNSIAEDMFEQSIEEGLRREMEVVSE